MKVMSIEALAMAGVNYHHLNISPEEYEEQNSPPYLITRVKKRVSCRIILHFEHVQ